MAPVSTGPKFDGVSVAVPWSLCSRIHHRPVCQIDWSGSWGNGLLSMVGKRNKAVWVSNSDRDHNNVTRLQCPRGSGEPLWRSADRPNLTAKLIRALLYIPTTLLYKADQATSNSSVQGAGQGVTTSRACKTLGVVGIGVVGQPQGGGVVNGFRAAVPTKSPCLPFWGKGAHVIQTLRPRGTAI